MGHAPAGEWARICDIPDYELGNVSPMEVIDVPDDTFLDAILLRRIAGLDTGDWEEYIREAGANLAEANMRAAGAQRRSAELRRAAGTLRAPRTVERKMANHNLLIGSPIDPDSRMGDAVAAGNAVIYTGAAITAAAAPVVSAVSPKASGAARAVWRGTSTGVQYGRQAADRAGLAGLEFLTSVDRRYVVARVTGMVAADQYFGVMGGPSLTFDPTAELISTGITLADFANENLKSLFADTLIQYEEESE